MLDEVDAYPGDVGGEGDPVDLAIQRAESYGHRKRILCISDADREGPGRIDRLYQETDRRRFFVPCARCGEGIVLEFAALRLEHGRALYRCPLCERDIEERDKLAMLEAGEWQPTSVVRSRHARLSHQPDLQSRGRPGAICCAAPPPPRAIPSAEGFRQHARWASAGVRPRWKCPRPKR